MRWLLSILLILLSGCSRPVYVDKGAGDGPGLIGQDVEFQVFDTYKSAPPDCVAVLPLMAKEGGQGALVRQSVYAHLSTQSKRGVRLERVDHVAKEVGNDLEALAIRIHCDAVITGRVTEYGATFLGLYSRVAVGVDLTMIRVSDGAALWTGKHAAVSHGGSVPLDLVGVGMAFADAVGNALDDEMLLRLTDDVSRRLVSTIPDNVVLAEDEPPTLSRPPPDDLVEAERLLSAGDYGASMRHVQTVLDQDPTKDRAWFLKARLLLLDREYVGAGAAALKSVALGGRQAPYLDVLGAIAVAHGDKNRALAAYRMAIEVDRQDGFAWYNSAVIHYNAKKWDAAAEHFYGAALAYLKTKNYPRAERALGDLKDLSAQGLSLQTKIQFIEDSLTYLKQRKT